MWVHIIKNCKTDLVGIGRYPWHNKKLKIIMTYKQCQPKHYILVVQQNSKKSDLDHLDPRWPRPPHSVHIILPVPPQPTCAKISNRKHRQQRKNAASIVQSSNTSKVHEVEQEREYT